MAQTGYGWQVRSSAAAIVMAVGIAGCGASSATPTVRSSVHAYVAALMKHDVAAACAVITPAYWTATASEVNGERANVSLAPLPRRNCRRGMQRMIARTSARSATVLRTPVRPATASTFTLTDLRIRGRVATAHLIMGARTSGAPTVNARFIKAPGGVWQIDCCTGTQVSRPPTAAYWISSESMEPTVKMGQRVTTANAAMRSHPPALGDIVVFHPPAGAVSEVPVCSSRTEGSGHRQPCGVSTSEESGQTFIKRVVGLPGDRIAIVSGHVIRNGVREKDPYTLPCLSINAAQCTFPKPIVVAPGKYYMLGDNRAASDDSRFWGPVKRAWIIGVVTR